MFIKKVDTYVYRKIIYKFMSTNNTNYQNHFDKTNFDNVYLRCVIIGFLGFLRKRFVLTQQSVENGEQTYTLPIHYSLTGDNRYVMDAFYDDVPDKRVNMNTDSIPRGVVTLKSWAVKPDEFTNSNIWLNVHKEIDDEILQYATQIKSVPVKLTFTLDTIVDNEIDVFKIWQVYMENMWIYKYFTFDFNHIPINAVFNFISDTDSPIIREFKFGDIELLKTTYTFDVHTFFPILDLEDKMKANKRINWLSTIWQTNKNNDNPPIGGIK